MTICVRWTDPKNPNDFHPPNLHRWNFLIYIEFLSTNWDCFFERTWKKNIYVNFPDYIEKFCGILENQMFYSKICTAKSGAIFGILVGPLVMKIYLCKVFIIFIFLSENLFTHLKGVFGFLSKNVFLALVKIALFHLYE